MFTLYTQYTNQTTDPSNFKLLKLQIPTERGDWLPDADNLECGYRTSVGYIIGGETAKRGEFPFTALLGYGGLRGSLKLFCVCNSEKMENVSRSYKVIISNLTSP